MPSWAVFFTKGIYSAVVHLVPSQGVDQDGLAEGHGHHRHYQGEHNKERHGHFDEAGEAVEASEDGEDGEASEAVEAGVAEVVSECKLIKAKSL